MDKRRVVCSNDNIKNPSIHNFCEWDGPAELCWTEWQQDGFDSEPYEVYFCFECGSSVKILDKKMEDYEL